jgi:serine/threonine-protein kinase RsbW
VTESEPTAQAVGAADVVELTVPADSAYVSVLRTVTASLAARRDFTIEEIDDLRIAVDEASALLLPHATGTSQLMASFGGGADSLHVRVAITDATPSGPEPDLDETSFAWMVLSALADEVSTDRFGGGLAVTLAKTRSARAS